jgi:1-acyl-sn-glycerol-3-phosphate acyltransferase
MQKLARFILRLIGWKYEITAPEFKQAVIVVAPHTSNWDFILGKLGYMAMGRFAHFAIKKEWTSAPLIGSLMRKIGGIPVDRSKATHFTDQIAAEFKKDPNFCIAITPEGTRKLNPRWKRGFYHIAVKAGVPIVMVKIDYGQKKMSLFDLFTPTGDEHADIKTVKEKYRGAVARHPENFSIGD